MRIMAADTLRLRSHCRSQRAIQIFCCDVVVVVVQCEQPAAVKVHACAALHVTSHVARCVYGN